MVELAPRVPTVKGTHHYDRNDDSEMMEASSLCFMAAACGVATLRRTVARHFSRIWQRETPTQAAEELRRVAGRDDAGLRRRTLWQGENVKTARKLEQTAA